MTSITIPAHPLLLAGWCGPAIMHEAGASADVAVLGPDDRPEAQRFGPWTAMAVSGEWPWPCWTGTKHLVRSVTTESLTLDLRRPEVQDRVSRVMWGVSGARVVIDWSNQAQVYAANHWRAASEQWAHDILAVPGLAILTELPETDRLPAALRLCWMRWLESQP